MRPAVLALVLVGCSTEPKLRAACAAGDADACDVLRARYAYGDGVPKDPKRAQEYADRVRDLCEGPGASAAACSRGGEVRAIPLDLPRPAPGTSAGVSSVISVVLAADGSTTVNGVPVADDAALAAAVRANVAPDVRAVIKADSAVPHGRVIHTLDLLKQAGVAKIAFGVTPIAPSAPP